MNKYSVYRGHLNLIHCLLILIDMSHPIQCQIAKCCPTDSILRISNGLSCEPMENRSIWDSHNIPIFSIPNCSLVHKVFDRNEKYIELNGCIDKDSDDQFVAVSCSNNPVIGVHLINKCCPPEQSYDYKARLCTEDHASNANLKSLFDNEAVVFDNKVPNCSEDEVFVENFSNIHVIKFDGMILKVDEKSLTSEKFCIDDLVNIDPSEEIESKNHFIVRSCRPRSVCDEIPCIRRCCKVDQIIMPQPGGSKVCQIHPNKTNLLPIFHDVSTLERPMLANPKGKF